MQTINKSSTILFLVIIIFVIGSFASLKKIGKIGTASIDNFESCIKAGYPVQESFPRTCTDDAGNSYVESLNAMTGAITNEKVHVFFPTPGIVVATPISFSGEAKGNWYFEGSFPVEVRDLTGKVVARAVARSEGDWMTDKFVPFEDEIAVPLSVDTGNLFLVLKKDNPSGDPERDEEVVIPIKYIRR
ncbi:MAG: Gmad2 immunoglobulin-like domain-containing protein [Minisyncoccia bacterium]